MQDTPVSTADVELGGTGNDCDVQAVPFHPSARLMPTVPTVYAPTASQKVERGQETPSNTGPAANTVLSAGSGVLCTCQAVPSQRSANVRLRPDVLTAVPTAVQALAAEHDMASSCPPGTVAFGEF